GKSRGAAFPRTTNHEPVARSARHDAIAPLRLGLVQRLVGSLEHFGRIAHLRIARRETEARSHFHLDRIAPARIGAAPLLFRRGTDTHAVRLDARARLLASLRGVAHARAGEQQAEFLAAVTEGARVVRAAQLLRDRLQHAIAGVVAVAVVEG